MTTTASRAAVWEMVAPLTRIRVAQERGTVALTDDARALLKRAARKASGKQRRTKQRP
jgi:hypothetical protein